MTIERNVDGLKAHAQQKRQETLDKAEKAIEQLIKEGRRVNFNTVAEAGDVSKAWLYDEPQIRERIEQLRKQSTPKHSLPPEQKMSDESKSAIIGLHKQKIKKLEEENCKLLEQLQVSNGKILETEKIDSKLERLERENQQLRLERDALRAELNEFLSAAKEQKALKPNPISESEPSKSSVAKDQTEDNHNPPIDLDSLTTDRLFLYVFDLLYNFQQKIDSIEIKLNRMIEADQQEKQSIIQVAQLLKNMEPRQKNC
jgi:hypothetical protein